MGFRSTFTALVALSTGLLVLADCARALEPPKAGDDVSGYLDQCADWYRRVTALGQSPVNSQEVLFRDGIRQTSRQAVRLGFDFGRAEAEILGADERAAGPASRPAAGVNPKLTQQAAAAVQRVTQLQTQVDQLESQIRGAAPDLQPGLTARRDRLTSELNLAAARRDVLANLAGFMSDRGDSPGDVLLRRVEDLERSMPDAPADTGPAGSRTDAQKGAAPPTDRTAAAPPAAQQFNPDSAGIFALVSGMFTLSARVGELKSVADQAKSLQADNERLGEPIRRELGDAIRQADVIGRDPATDDPVRLAAQRDQIDALTDRFKRLSAAAVPLREQNILLGATRANLLQWRTSLEGQFTSALRHLLFRVGGMALAIVLLLAFSNIWRRATFRYVADVRRRRQFLVVRRFLVGALIVLIVIATFVTEFGSLATFAGILTAGLAVALQTFIVSGVAYFFFIGRFGVRVGERVTVSGITGDVVDIGLFRLYLMELGGTGLDRHPTGRIVVFANSVLFQPQAFFKQLPGAEYAWHQVTLSLAPGGDYAGAEARVGQAVESTFAGYRDAIDRQHALMTRTIHMQLPPPRPQARLRFTDAGPECVVRYPVELDRAAEIDDQVIRGVLEAIGREPRLQLAGTGVPRVQAAD